jgi:putative sterol carrier protein
MPHPFLSPEWIEAVKAVREKYAAEASKVATSIRMNLVVTDAPAELSSDGTINSYLDTSSSDIVLDLGELDTPDLTLTTDYDIARKLLVDQDQAAAMQAFLSGKIMVQGDMMKMMAMQTSMPSDDTAHKVADEIKSLTA